MCLHGSRGEWVSFRALNEIMEMRRSWWPGRALVWFTSESAFMERYKANKQTRASWCQRDLASLYSEEETLFTLQVPLDHLTCSHVSHNSLLLRSKAALHWLAPAKGNLPPPPWGACISGTPSVTSSPSSWPRCAAAMCQTSGGKGACAARRDVRNDGWRRVSSTLAREQRPSRAAHAGRVSSEPVDASWRAELRRYWVVPSYQTQPSQAARPRHPCRKWTQTRLPK